MLVQGYRQGQAYYGGLLAAAENPDSKKKLFDEYRAAMFPYAAKALRDQQSKMKAVLDRAFDRGPILISLPKER